ncbi:hypothetical protein MPSEU_000319800 [Mayamaea pseudoterrestris]|nr:hypothetical protein MPSEU_000319800 [Mayamaea pseudoterrestris]
MHSSTPLAMQADSEERKGVHRNETASERAVASPHDTYNDSAQRAAATTSEQQPRSTMQSLNQSATMPNSGQRNSVHRNANNNAHVVAQPQDMGNVESLLNRAACSTLPQQQMKQQDNIEIIEIKNSSSEDELSNRSGSKSKVDERPQTPTAITTGHSTAASNLSHGSLLEQLNNSNQECGFDDDFSGEEKKGLSVLETMFDTACGTGSSKDASEHSVATKELPSLASRNGSTEKHRHSLNGSVAASHGTNVFTGPGQPPFSPLLSTLGQGLAQGSNHGTSISRGNKPQRNAGHRAHKGNIHRHSLTDGSNNSRKRSQPFMQQLTNGLDSTVEFDTQRFTYDKAAKRLMRHRVLEASGRRQKGFLSIPSTSKSPVKRTRSMINKNLTTAGNPIWSLSAEREKEVMMVGSSFQSAIPPRQIWSHAVSHPLAAGHSIWDPSKAEQAKSRGEPIEEFMNTGGSLDLQTLKMEALHLSGYNIQKAKAYMQSHSDAVHATSINLTEEEETKFLQLLLDDTNPKKQLHRISKTLGLPMRKVLIQYYRWKKSYPSSYKVLKAKEADECAKCHDGGDLVLCDKCNKAYHWKTCLLKPLEFPPAQDEIWHCDNCSNGSPEKSRLLCMSGNRHRHASPSSAQQAMPNDVRNQLRMCHLELLDDHQPAVDEACRVGDFERPKPQCDGMFWDKRLRVYRFRESEGPDRSQNLRQNLFSSQDGDVSANQVGILAIDDDNDSDASASSSGISSSSDKKQTKQTTLKNNVEIQSGPDSSDSSFHDSDIVDDGDSEDEERIDNKKQAVVPTISTFRALATSSSKQTPRMPTTTYTAVVPIGSNGLGVSFAETLSKRIIFSEYRRENDCMGLAEIQNAFKNVNDEVLEVEGMSCVDKPFFEVMEYIRNILARAKGRPGQTIRFKMGTLPHKDAGIRSAALHARAQPSHETSVQRLRDVYHGPAVKDRHQQAVPPGQETSVQRLREVYHGAAAKDLHQQAVPPVQEKSLQKLREIYHGPAAKASHQQAVPPGQGQQYPAPSLTLPPPGVNYAHHRKAVTNESVSVAHEPPHSRGALTKSTSSDVKARSGVQHQDQTLAQRGPQRHQPHTNKPVTGGTNVRHSQFLKANVPPPIHGRYSFADPTNRGASSLPTLSETRMPRDILPFPSVTEQIIMEPSMRAAFSDQPQFLVFLQTRRIMTSSSFFNISSDALAHGWAQHLGQPSADSVIRDFVGALKFRLGDYLRKCDIKNNV